MKFRKKPIVIEAEQWFPGKAIDGVRVVECEAVYSRDGKWYYIRNGNCSCTQWLSVEAYPGPVSESQAKETSNPFAGGYAQFTPTGETTYHRKHLPFAFFELKSGEVKPLSKDDRLFLDYGCVERWTNIALEPPQEGYIDTLEGTHKVIPGDWIITGIKGEKYPCKPDIFEATYELAGEN